MVLAGTPLRATSSDRENRRSVADSGSTGSLGIPQAAGANRPMTDMSSVCLSFIGYADRRTGRDGAHAALLEILEGLGQLGPGVHDERAVVGDRLADGSAAEHQNVEAGGPAVLGLVGGHDDRVARPEDGQLPALDRPVVRPDPAATGEDVDQGIGLRGPRAGPAGRRGPRWRAPW